MIYQLILALISGIFISGVAGYLGTLMLSKKMSVVAGPLSHLALPGVAIALLYNFSDIAIGVFPFTIIGAILIWLLQKRTNLPMENLAAIIFATGVGTALLFLPINKAEEALVGKIMEITFWETIIIVALGFFVFYFIKKLYLKMMLININEDLAVIEGINVSHYNLLYLLSIAIVVSLGVYLVGGLITAALIAIPAAASRNISSELRSYKFWAVIFGIFSAISGIFLAYFFKLPAGPMVIVSSIFIFLISLLFQKQQTS